ncbi:MAG: serine kinase [Bacteroidales bacterium]|nr:serine kinase [Bacteroidales bacterium]HPD94599.1 DRTGG domain-containing protein [Tenuifilaceae bacterium]
MTVKDLVETLQLKVFSGSTGMNREVTGGYSSDLLSDVMGNAESGMVWITLQTHVNVMAIASLKELSAIILVKGFEPEENTLTQSNVEGIPILGTTLQTFEISGKLYQLLNS